MNVWTLADALDDAKGDPWIGEDSPLWVLIGDNLMEIVSVDRAPREDGKGPVVLRARPLSRDAAQKYTTCVGADHGKTVVDRG
jgi:hypothetical protein